MDCAGQLRLVGSLDNAGRSPAQIAPRKSTLSSRRVNESRRHAGPHPWGLSPCPAPGFAFFDEDVLTWIFEHFHLPHSHRGPPIRPSGLHVGGTTNRVAPYQGIG